MKLSVALCTFNGASFLPAQLDSLRTQSRLPDELIVCDDASCDNTLSLCRDFANLAPFPVRIVSNSTNLGSTKNFEQAVSLCTGDVILPCDQDDVWQPNKLARIHREFELNPSLGLTFSDAWLATPDLVRTGRRAWQVLPFTPKMQRAFDAGTGPELLLRYNVVSGATLAFRADLRNVLLPIPAKWVHDAWIGFLAASVSEVRTIPEPLIVYRQHPEQQIGISRRTLSRQLRAAFTRIDAAYYDAIADRFSELAYRLEQLGDNPILAAIREKAAFARDQSRMREQHRIRRAWTATRHLAAGRYHRFAHGLRSFAVDVLLK